MRNLKKILALALALVMTLSLMTVANAFNDDKDIDAKYDEAVTVLSELKVFKVSTMAPTSPPSRPLPGLKLPPSSTASSPAM